MKKTIESVFEQTFIDFEYIVIDGDSADSSKEYIEQYTNKLAYWISEKDGGVYEAMNKGIAQASGTYLLFLNSGDYFNAKDVLQKLLKESNNEDIIYGNIYVIEKENSWIKTYPAVLSFEYFLKDTLPHPASLIHASLFKKTGMYNQSNRIVSDWEFFLNAICKQNASYKYVPLTVAVFNRDGLSSLPQSHELIKEEKQRVLQMQYAGFLPDYQEKSRIESELNNIRHSRVYKFSNTLRRLLFIK